jgi:peptide-methionine (S)-S-oxide reductase
MAGAMVTCGAQAAETATAIFAGGCFWSIESDFDHAPGVVSTTSGYIGGHVENPTYEQVVTETTGHREAVKVEYDPSVTSYETLLDTFFHLIDPIESRGQFCDFGEQYRPVIWVHDAAQRAAAEASKAHVQQIFNKPVAVTIEDAGPFYAAEEYHQDFHTKSSVRYNYYRWGCGRDARLAEIWRSAAY